MANEYKSPLAIFYEWEKSIPNKVYFHQPIAGRSLEFTWQQTGDQIRRMAAALKAMNLPEKSKIGIVSKNCAHWIMSDLAIMMSGHISVPIYPNVSDKTINYVLSHSEAQVLFVGKLDDWASMKPGVPDDVHCISFPTYYGDTGYEQWDDIINQHEPLSGSPDRDPNDIMTIIYTSGTTGTPKGVVHTFHAFSYAANNALAGGIIDVGKPNGRFFSYLPLSHIAERMLIGMGGVYTGSEVFFAESLDTFAKNLSEAKPTVFLAVPRIWTKFQMGILSKMPQNRLDLLLKVPFLSTFIKRKIRKGLGLDDALHCLTGAAPTPPSLMKWFEKLGIKIQEVYGMTENCAYSHYTRKSNIQYGSTGQPMPHVDCIISDIGEILVKSEANMVGYYKEPEKSAASFQDEYLRTGDKGSIDANGFLTITGRVKDIFKTAKGKYVAPAPIELKLNVNTNIEQVCIVGVNLPQTMALIVLSEEAAKGDKQEIADSLAETVNAVNATLDKHEKIKKAVVLKEPWTIENDLMTPTLKIKRDPLENKFKDHYEQWYNNGGLVVWE
jgi:long-chain acyl-CoA synthetase